MKRMPDGFCHRAFFLLELLCKRTLQNDGLRVFNEAKSAFARSRIPPFGNLGDGWNATSVTRVSLVLESKSLTVICSCKKERA